jgi:hypothetical protein
VLWASLVYGVLVWAGATFVVLPVLDPALVRAELGLGGLGSCLVFGLVLGLAFERLRLRAVATAGARHLGRTVTITPHPHPH